MLNKISSRWKSIKIVTMSYRAKNKGRIKSVLHYIKIMQNTITEEACREISIFIVLYICNKGLINLYNAKKTELGQYKDTKVTCIMYLHKILWNKNCILHIFLFHQYWWGKLIELKHWQYPQTPLLKRSRKTRGQGMKFWNLVRNLILGLVQHLKDFVY